MTRRLEETFNLPPIPDDENENDQDEESFFQGPPSDIVEIEDAISISEKINSALAEVHGMESHDGEMDEIAREAMDSYQQLMRLGMDISDMAAGPVFSNASAMLKVALDAKDSKVNRKLKQIDMMLKKARLDQTDKNAAPAPTADESGETPDAYVYDRNEILKALVNKNKDK